MRVNRKQTFKVRPRAPLFSTAKLALSLVIGLCATGCGAASHSANADAPQPPSAPANAVQPARTSAQETAPRTAMPDGASGPGTNANSAAGNSTSEPSADAQPVGAPSEEEAASSTQDFTGTAGLTEKKREVSGVAVLREVRSASHPGFDRVVFVFDGNILPGHRVEYVDRPVRQCGSGRPVRVIGDGWLLVRLEPANAHTEAGEPTVTKRERRLNYPNLKELKLICDFEAQVEWVLGLGSPKRYRVLELRNPARLVIDVKR